MKDDAPVAELRDVVRRFARGAAPAVDGVSLALRSRDVLALLGPSGCGKSTTLRLLAGFERPDAGEVWLGGRLVATAANVAPAGPAEAGRRGARRPAWVPPEQRRLGMVFQDFALFPHLTAAENVAFGLRRLGRTVRDARVAELLRTVGLAGLGDRYPHQLSGGQQQRVALARALAPWPRAVLLDEPFNTLDAGLRRQVRRDLLAILRAEGVPVLLVTHDQEEALGCADRVAVMRAGRLEQMDDPATLYNRPSTRFVAGFVGDGRFVPAVLAGGRIETPFGAVAAADPAIWLLRSEGEPADLLVRPEDARIVPDRAGNAIVTERRAGGAQNEYELTLRPDPVIDPQRLSSVRLAVRSPAWLDVGIPVRVSLAPRHLVLFQGERAVLRRCLVPDCGCPPVNLDEETASIW